MFRMPNEVIDAWKKAHPLDQNGWRRLKLSKGGDWIGISKDQIFTIIGPDFKALKGNAPRILRSKPKVTFIDHKGKKASPKTPEQLDLMLLIGLAQKVGRIQAQCLKKTLTWAAYYTELNNLRSEMSSFEAKYFKEKT